MSNKNDVTGDTIVSKTTNLDSYKEGWDRIFGKPEEKPTEQVILEKKDENPLDT